MYSVSFELSSTEISCRNNNFFSINGLLLGVLLDAVFCCMYVCIQEAVAVTVILLKRDFYFSEIIDDPALSRVFDKIHFIIFLSPFLRFY